VALRLILAAFCHQYVNKLDISFLGLKAAFIPLSEPGFTEFTGFSEFSEFFCMESIIMSKFGKAVLAVGFGLSFCFAQDPPALIEELPKLSVAQVLSSVNLSGSCVEDFTNLLEKDGFDMAKFMKELPPAVAKVKAQLKSPFGKPNDSDRTGVGLTVGCIKALPESPAEVTSLLKDISLKMGLDLAVAAAASVADNSIPANVAKESGSGGKLLLPICLAAGGLVAVIYGIAKDGDVAHYVKNRDGKAAVDAEKSRNMGYGIGAALLAGGLVVYIVF